MSTAATDSNDTPQARLQAERMEAGWRLHASGSWTADRLEAAVAALDILSRRLEGERIVWDFSGVVRMDTAGLMLYLHHKARLAAHGCRQEAVGRSREQIRLEALLQRYRPEVGEVSAPTLGHRLLAPVAALGRATLAAARGAQEFLAFLGEHGTVLLHTFLHPGTLRLDAVARNIQDAGIRALPIITLTSFLIGVVIAYQGAVQLQKFGANLFIVDMIGISVTRELAPLITAIVVAGRTGSAYTAQLGVMKITEEIDAMRVMGFDPHRFLVLPRILALMIALPLMIFFADLVGILGGMVVAHLHLDLSWSEFIHRLQNVLEVKHFWIGIVKGPFFAWLIAVVGCFRGLQVSRNTESIGYYTTVSVVNAIFLVIACDALFSVIFTELGI